MKNIFIVIFNLFVINIIISNNSVAQKSSIQLIIPPELSKNTLNSRQQYKKNFDVAVQKMNSNDLDSAILYFSQALENYKHADAYYNRAITYLRLRKGIEFCKDLKEARKLGDIDSDSLYCLRCIKKDTIFLDSLRQITDPRNSRSAEFVEISKYDASRDTVIFNRNTDGYYYFPLYKMLIVKSINPSIELPKYPGKYYGLNISGLFKFAPEYVIPKYGSVTTKCSFRISDDGKVIDVKHLDGNSKYFEVVKNRLSKLSKWEPAKLNGKYEDVEIIMELTSYSNVTTIKFK